MSTTKELRNAAEELIEVLGLIDETTEEPIVLKKEVKGKLVELTEGEIVEIIKDSAKEITPDDEISDETREVIDEILNASKKKTSTAKGKKVPVAVEIEEDEDDVDDEIEEDEIKPLKKETKKAPVTKGKKAIVIEEDNEEDDDEDEEIVEEKPVKEKKSAKVKAEKIVKEKKITSFGLSIELLCSNPSMDIETLKKKVKSQGIDPDKGNGLRSATVIVKKIVRLLKENKLMK